MSQMHQIAVELPEDLFSEIEQLVEEDKDSFFKKVLENHLEKKKGHDLRFQMKRGYLEMASINAEIAEEFVYAEGEAEDLLLNGRAFTREDK